MCGQCFIRLVGKKKFLLVGIRSTKGERCLLQGKLESCQLHFLLLQEGKHSGIKIGHEQQKFRNKKLAIKKRFQYNWIGNYLKKKRHE